MTHAHILGPPRTGRRVLTKEEFLEEMAECESSSRSDQIQPVEVPAQVKPFTHPYFIAPGRFNVGSIQELPGGYFFHDLEVPMGCWDLLWLEKSNLEGGPANYHNWTKNAPTSQVKGLIPADIWYGLMAVCFDHSKDPSTKDVIEKIRREIFIRDMTIPSGHLATNLSYGGGLQTLIRPGGGWPSSHPFWTDYGAYIHSSGLRLAERLPSDDPSVPAALEGVFGETSPRHCRTVLEWASQCAVYLKRADSQLIGERAVSFYIIDRSLQIDLCSDVAIKKDARAIVADPQFFKRE